MVANPEASPSAHYCNPLQLFWSIQSSLLVKFITTNIHMNRE
jgi:hypothetical protein